MTNLALDGSLLVGVGVDLIVEDVSDRLQRFGVDATHSHLNRAELSDELTRRAGVELVVSLLGLSKDEGLVGLLLRVLTVSSAGERDEGRGPTSEL